MANAADEKNIKRLNNASRIDVLKLSNTCDIYSDLLYQIYIHINLYGNFYRFMNIDIDINLIQKLESIFPYITNLNFLGSYYKMQLNKFNKEFAGGNVGLILK